MERLGSGHVSAGVWTSRTPLCAALLGLICVQLALSEDQIAAMFEEAQRAFHSGQFDRAIATYQDVLRIRPGLAEARVNLGLVYFSAGDYTSASTEMARVLQQQPSLGAANAILGMSYLKLGFAQKAAAPLRRAVRLAPADREAATALAECEVALHNYREAGRQFRAVFAMEQNRELALFQLGHSYLRLSKQLTEELSGDSHDFSWVHRLKGDLLAEQCLWTEAAKEYAAASELDPAQKGLSSELDYVRSRRGEPSGSCGSNAAKSQFDWMRKVVGRSCASGSDEECASQLQAKPLLSASEHVALGKVSLRIGNDEAASDEFAAALALKKDDAESRYWLIRSYARLSDAVFAELVGAFPDSVRTHQLRAETFAVRGAYTNAIEEYRTAIRLFPQELELYEELGGLYIATHAFTEAQELLDTALRRGPNARVCHLLGQVYLELEQPERAVAYLENASAMVPELPELHADLGKAYFRVGNMQLAARELKHAAPIDRSGDLHYLLYQSYVKLGEPRLAAAALAQSRSLREAAFTTDRKRLTGAGAESRAAK